MVGGFFTYQCSQNFVEQKEHFLSGVNESEAIWASLPGSAQAVVSVLTLV